MKNSFKNNNVNLGDVKAGSKNVKVVWHFDQIRKGDIHVKSDGSYDIRKACTCTADFKVYDDRLEALYTDSSTQASKIYKDVYVYLSSNEKTNERGISVNNGENIHLTFYANIVN